ncbi:MAG: asparagine synthase (glutamine-hydrolyzing) [Verrucomicrobiota bacterium]
MCGICGFLGSGSATDLARMSAFLVHRGPDDSGTWSSVDPPVHLANRRLAVVDLPGGHQPMRTVDGDLVITFNGEIYNHRELRADLQKLGHKFQSDHSDTEVLLLGYREWGTGLPARLNGMWAFALYDAKRGQLFCSRDRFGKKPFYYARRNNGLVFASELTALTAHPNVPRDISRRALQKYFAYGYIPSPMSILEGVKKLPAGCSLIIDARSLDFRIEKYWDLLLEPFEKIPRHPEQEWGEQLRELLERAVKRRLIVDVPVGVFLSGGIDSAAVTAFASRHVGDGKLKTFSIGFHEKSFDETQFGKRVSAKFGTDHRAEALSPARARDLIDECLTQMDEPLGDNSLLPTYLLSGFTRKHVTVALGGDGGDELFAGYDPFLALKAAEMYRAVFPRPAHAAIKALFQRLPVSHASMSFDFKMKRTLRGLDYPSRFWLPVWMAPLDRNGLEDLFSEPIDFEDVYSEAIEQWENCPQQDLVDKTLQFYTKLYLQDDILMKVDRASMMHGLEVRAPFLDIDLVDFVRRIPNRYKFRNGTTKYLLKKALTGILPDEILYRRKKGFGTPVGEWFKTGDLQIEDTEFESLNARFIERKIAAHRSGRSDEKAFLWNFYALSKWQQARKTRSASRSK